MWKWEPQLQLLVSKFFYRFFFGISFIYEKSIDKWGKRSPNFVRMVIKSAQNQTAKKSDKNSGIYYGVEVKLYSNWNYLFWDLSLRMWCLSIATVNCSFKLILYLVILINYNFNIFVFIHITVQLLFYQNIDCSLINIHCLLSNNGTVQDQVENVETVLLGFIRYRNCKAI